MFPFLFSKEIKDEYTQENFVRLVDYFRNDAYTRTRFKFFEFVIPEVTRTPAIALVYPYTAVIPHYLGFLPKDVITLHNLNNVTLTWNYTAFTKNNVSFTVSAATTIRALIGRYEDG